MTAYKMGEFFAFHAPFLVAGMGRKHNLWVWSMDRCGAQSRGN